MEKERLEIFRERVFGDKLNATFDFVRENWRPMLKYMTYMMLPLACVAGVLMKGWMSYYMNMMVAKQQNPEVGFIVSYGLTILVYVFASLLLASLVYSMMRIYRERKDRLKDLTYEELKPTFWRFLKRMLLLGLCFLVLYILAFLLIILIATLTLWSLLLTVPALIILAMPLLYWPPAYLLDNDLSLFAALKKSYRLGFPTWGGIFLIAIVLGMLSVVISSVVSIPWSVGFFSYLMLSEAGEGQAPVVMEFVMYLLNVVQSYCMLVVSSLSLVGMAFQYGHAADKIDGITVERNIENFEHLGDNNVDAPDVMGMNSEFDDFDKL